LTVAVIEHIACDHGAVFAENFRHMAFAAGWLPYEAGPHASKEPRKYDLHQRTRRPWRGWKVIERSAGLLARSPAPPRSRNRTFALVQHIEAVAVAFRLKTGTAGRD